MSIALDFMVLGIVTVTAIIGYCRGFVRYVLKMLGTIVCVVVALVVSDLAAAPIYNRVVAPMIEKKLNSEMQNFDIAKEAKKVFADMGIELPFDEKKLRSVLSDAGSIPAAFERAALDSGSTSEKAAELKEKADTFFDENLGETLAKAAGLENYEEIGERIDLTAAKGYDLVRAFASGSDNSNGVHYLVYNILDNMIVTIIRYALFVIILIVCEVILAVVFRVAGVLDHLPAVSGANRFLGLGVGVLKGMLYVGLIAAICSSIVKSDSILDPQIFEDSYVFSIFFNIFYK